jgi:thioredoxin-dependent peroxiredoxin
MPELAMKKAVAMMLLTTAVVPAAFAALSVGQPAPSFSAPAALDGKPFDFSLQNALKNGPVVVYFYPSAYTGGCNLQAHTFSVNHDKFAAAKATVIGVSGDSVERLVKFSADPDFCAGKVAVASDPKGAVAKQYDLMVREGKPGMKDTTGAEIGHGFTERTTFVLSKDGKIAATITGVAPDENVKQALAAVQSLK